MALNIDGIAFDNLTTTERNALVNPPQGLVIYNVTTGRLETNDGSPSVPDWTASSNITSGDIGAEPAFTKNTAFNKDFGVGSGQVVEGDKIGAANGIAPLNGSSKIDSSYLPAYVDDVLEFANLAAFPGTGETGKIYVALDTNKLYRWSGATYIETSSDVAETTTTIGSLINGATEKTTPVDADMVGLMDSAGSNILKKLSWANIKATLKTYFDTLYKATFSENTAFNKNFGTTSGTVLEGDKNAAIVANTAKVSNVTTDLSIGTKTATTVDVNSSDGTDATIPAATITEAGLLTATNQTIAGEKTFNDAVIIAHDSNSDLNLIFDAEGRNGAAGSSISKVGASGFLALMPNAEVVQWIAGNPAAANGVNDFYIDVDNEGILRLNTLGGAGANGEVIATNAAPLRPSGDGTSNLGTASNRWNELRAVTLYGSGSNITGLSSTQVGLGNVPNTDATQRSNHSGTQLASTISNFAATVRSTVLTGLSLATSTAVTATDSILVAIGKLQAQLNAKVYGTQFTYNESLAESSTTSTTYQTKVTLTTASLPAGDYVLEWMFDGSNSSNGVLSEYQVVMDGTQVGNNTMEADNDFLSFSGFAKRTFTSGVKTCTIEYKRHGGTCLIKNARLKLIRVS